MIIESIKLTNWMAFAGVHTLNLPRGPIAVVATYTSDADRSNWAGKTALLEAIEWALYGAHRKRYDDDIIFDGADEVEVEVELSGVTITRRRKRGKSTELRARTPATVYAKESAQVEIERLVGMDAADFRATLCFAQGDTEAIVARTSGARRQVLAQWLDLDAWQRAATRARAHAAGVSIRRVAIDTQVTNLTNTIAMVDANDLQVRINTESQESEASQQERDEIERELRELASLEVRKRAALRLRQVGTLLREAKVTIDQAVEVDLDSARQEFTAASELAARLGREYQDARRLERGEFDGECPILCAECPVADTVRAETARGATLARQARAGSRSAEEALVVAKARLGKAESLAATQTVARARHTDLAKEARELRAQAESVAYPDESTAPHEARLLERKAVAVDRARTADRNIAHIREALMIHGRNLAEQQRLLSALSDIEPDAHAASLAVQCLGPMGVSVDIASAALLDLQTRTNALLSETGLSISFEWDRETKDLAPACHACGYIYRGKRDKECPACKAERLQKRTDELEILTRDESGVVEDIRVKSGGARALVASAIRLTASALLRERRQGGLSVAMVDEPFGSLDSRNRTQLARTFAGMLGAVGLGQALVVSHDAALLDSLPAKILITRHADRSTVEVLC